MKGNFIKRCVLGLAVILGAITLASCGSTGEGQDASIDISKLTAEEIAEYKKEEIVIYTNSGSGGRETWWKQEAKKAGFNVTIITGGADAMAEKIKAEKKNPQADVICGLNAMEWEDLKANDCLLPFNPSWKDKVDAGLNDEDGYYYAINQEVIFLVYDNKVWTEETAPKDWTDLWTKEQYYGTYQAWSSLTGGTTQSNLAGILWRYKSDAADAKYGVSPEGWAQIKALYDHGVSASGDVINAIAATSGVNKNIHCGQWYSSGIQSYSEAYNVSLSYVVPEVGVPNVITGCGITKNTKKAVTAQLFLDWYGSTEFQTLWAQTWDTCPANKEAREAGSSEFALQCISVKKQDIDWSWANQHMGEWIEYITLQFMK